MMRDERDVIKKFADSREIAGELRNLSVDLDGNYWLDEAAVHIEGLYQDACDMQRIIARLRAEAGTKHAETRLENR